MSGFPDWGNVPEYFSGLALVLTVITFNRARQEQQRTQAEKVAAWGAGDDGHYKLILRNQSDLPVTGLTISFNAGFIPKKGFSLTKYPRPDRHAKPRRLDMLSPGTTELLLPESMPGPVLITALRFRDSRGVIWIRSETGLQRGTRGRAAFEVKKRVWMLKRNLKSLSNRWKNVGEKS
jgi:hypothetical protein